MKKSDALKDPELVLYLRRTDLSLLEMSTRFGVHQSTIHQWRRSLGIITRKARAGQSVKLDFVVRRSIVLAKSNSIEAAKTYGVTHQRISQIRAHALLEPAFYGLTDEQVQTAREGRMRLSTSGRPCRPSGLDLAEQRAVILSQNSCGQAGRVYGVSRQRIQQLRDQALKDPASFGLTQEQVESARRARLE